MTGGVTNIANDRVLALWLFTVKGFMTQTMTFKTSDTFTTTTTIITVIPVSTPLMGIFHTSGFENSSYLIQVFIRGNIMTIKQTFFLWAQSGTKTIYKL